MPAFRIFRAPIKFAIYRTSQHNIAFIAFGAFSFDFSGCNSLCVLSSLPFNQLCRALWIKAKFNRLLCFLYRQNFRIAAGLTVFFCGLYQGIFWYGKYSLAVRIFIASCECPKFASPYHYIPFFADWANPEERHLILSFPVGFLELHANLLLIFLEVNQYFSNGFPGFLQKLLFFLLAFPDFFHLNLEMPRQFLVYYSWNIFFQSFDC